MREAVMFTLAALILAAAATPADAGKKGKKPPKETQNTQQEYYQIKMENVYISGRQSQSGGKTSPNAGTSGAARR